MNKNYYAIIPANVRYDEELTPNAKLLYGEITALCNEKGYCWASNGYFSDLYKVSKKSISNWINQLIDKKYILSQIIYKENSKEVLERRLYIYNPIEKNFHRYGTKIKGGIEEKFYTPIEEKVKDNNTSFNNTINKDSVDNFSNEKENIPYKEIIDYLNLKANKKYKYTKATISKINARYKEGFTLEDFKQVIDTKCSQWLNDSKMKQYLRPETLFGTKFEGYLNEEVSLKGNIQIPNTSFEGKSSNDILKEFNIEI